MPQPLNYQNFNAKNAMDARWTQRDRKPSVLGVTSAFFALKSPAEE
jgi:hypothetical protein